MYCTQTDMENRLDPKHLVELADDDADGTTDTAVVEAAIADADGLIDSHLRSRYSVPLDPVPALITKLSADLAIASLFARRRESASPVHESRARDAVALLEEIAKGKIVLAGVAESQIKGSPDSTTRDDDKVFSRDTLDLF
jgi:phage gp36-like protein